MLTPEHGELRVDVRGELAGILAMATDSKEPATTVGDGLQQIKVVAGACNPLYRNNRFLSQPR